MITEHKLDTDPVFDPAPEDASLKFNLDGSPRPFAGNTIICHLPPQSRVHDETVALADALRLSSFAPKCGILPNDSFHISVFPGVNDQGRGRYGWPADIPKTIAIGECNRIIGERIADFRVRQELPIRMRIDQEKSLSPQRVSSLRVSAADDHENAKIRTLRDRLAQEVFRFRTQDHADYVFHISLAYQMRPLSAREAAEHHALLAKHVPAVIAAAPIIELGLPEFCTFKDMFRFDVQSLLRT